MIALAFVAGVASGVALLAVCLVSASGELLDVPVVVSAYVGGAL